MINIRRQPLTLTYPEEDADDNVWAVAGCRSAYRGSQVPQEEGQPASYSSHIIPI